MKALFIHDHNFVHEKETELYFDASGGAFTENLWKRYLMVFDDLIVIGREIEKAPNDLILSSSKNVTFRLFKVLSNPIKRYLDQRDLKNSIENIIDRVDFVIIRLPSYLGKLAHEICVRKRKKYILEIVGDPFEAFWNHGNPLAKIIAPIERNNLKCIVRKSPFVVYVTKSELQNKYPTPFKSAAISNVRLLECVMEESVREHYLKESKIFKLGLIGSFHIKYKGHIEALKALKYLVDKGYRSIQLFLVGTGDYKWVEDLAKEIGVYDNLNFVGVLEAGEKGIFPFIDNLDLYIHPSLAEGLPRVVIEAMSRGKMCLASNAGGTEELLDPAFIHKAGDWKQFAKQLESLILLNDFEKLEIALKNLETAGTYLESNLQEKRTNFIKSCINATN